MTDELAKQLKDAGFPQDKTEFAFVVLDAPKRVDIPPFWQRKLRADWNLPNLYDWFACPALSELIEACGKDFGHLAYWPAGNQAGDWQAVGGGETIWDKTPEIAVAKLWLALNKT